MPSLETLPTSPGRMILLLGLATCAVGATLGLFTLLGAAFVLALPGVEAQAMLRLSLVQGLVGGVVLSLVILRGVRGMRPLYLMLLRGPRDLPEGPRPDPRVIAKAFHWPERGVLLNTACTQLVPVLDALGVVSISGLDGWSRWSADLLSIAVATAGLMPCIVLYRSIVWRWLGRLHPNDITLEVRQHLSYRLAITLTLPVAVVGISAVVVLASHLVALRTRVAPNLQVGDLSLALDLVAGIFALLLIVAGVVVAWIIARRLGEQLARDLRALTAQIQRMHTSDAPIQQEVTAFARIAHTQAGQRLAASLSELAQRFDEMRQKEREGRLAMEQVQRLRTQFLASMSHDLRSPLNSILGFAVLISSGTEGPVTPEQRESIQMITRSARDLLRLVTNILDSARLEAGRLALRRRLTPAADILNQAVSDGRRMIEDRPLEIEADIQPGLPAVYVDADRVVQAVVGLFSHAIDAMERGTIRLVARVANGPPGPQVRHLRVDVVDRGAGIREADQEALFQAFREIQEPSGKRIGGLGLGLSLARELVKAHGGDVWFESESGKGTTFSVAIPVEPEWTPLQSHGVWPL
ncbi:MAG: HAMP domain-containing sensor histidine kinase [Myxococcales bacterium]